MVGLTEDTLQVQSLEQLERETATNSTLSEMVLGYYASGADSESSLKDNRLAFSRYRFIPRVLVDVSELPTRMSSVMFGALSVSPAFENG